MHSKLKPGDLLYRKKGFVEHAGVYLGRGQILHNSPSNDIEVTGYDTYSNGEAVKVVSIEKCDLHILESRLYQILNTSPKYQITHRNCEHVANLLVHGHAYSPQLNASVAGALLTGLLSWRSGSKYWYIFAIAGGVAACLISNLARSYDYKLESGPNANRLAAN